jgi:hypothetical protein
VKVPIHAQIIDGKSSYKSSKPAKPAQSAVFTAKMPQSHDELSGHGLIRGGSAQLGFLLGESLTRKRFVPNGSGLAMNGCSESICDKPVIRQLAEDTDRSE